MAAVRRGNTLTKMTARGADHHQYGGPVCVSGKTSARWRGAEPHQKGGEEQTLTKMSALWGGMPHQDGGGRPSPRGPGGTRPSPRCRPCWGEDPTKMAGADPYQEGHREQTLTKMAALWGGAEDHTKMAEGGPSPRRWPCVWGLKTQPRWRGQTLTKMVVLCAGGEDPTRMAGSRTSLIWR